MDYDEEAVGMNEVEIKDEFIKLDQFLKFVGVAQTGGESKIIISEDMVKVNGEVETRRGKKLRSGDRVEVEDHDEIYIIK